MSQSSLIPSASNSVHAVKFKKICKLCGKIFCSITSFYMDHDCVHILEASSEEKPLENRFFCPIEKCNKWFNKRLGLSAHLRSHSVNWICINCKYTTTSSKTALMHSCRDARAQSVYELKSAIPADHEIDYAIILSATNDSCAKKQDESSTVNLKRYFETFHQYEGFELPERLETNKNSGLPRNSNEQAQLSDKMLEQTCILSSGLQTSGLPIASLDGPEFVTETFPYDSFFAEFLNPFIEFRVCGFEKQTFCYIRGINMIGSDPIKLFKLRESDVFDPVVCRDISHRIIEEFLQLNIKSIMNYVEQQARIRDWILFHFLKCHWYQKYGLLCFPAFYVLDGKIHASKDESEYFVEMANFCFCQERRITNPKL